MDQIFNKWLSFVRLCTDKSLDGYLQKKIAEQCSDT